MQTDVEVVQRTPPEIWLSIFEHATFVPHAFDTDVADPFDVPGAPIPFDTSSKITSGRQLSRSDRSSWSANYGTISLTPCYTKRDNHGLKCLRNTLIQSEKSFTSHGSAKLRVRRLDLSSWPANELEVTPDLPIGLFAHLPNLEIFCTWDENHHVGGVAYDSRRSSRASFHHRTPRGVIAETQIIPDRQSLTCLSIDSVCEGAPVGADMQRWTRPLEALQNVHITLFSLSNGRKDGMEAFFCVQGAYLRTVQLDMRYCALPDCVEFYLGILTTHCPNLAHLIFIRGPLDKLWPPVSFPPTVNHLGIYVVCGVSPRGLSDHLELMRSLVDRGDKVPGVVRRLNASTEEEWEYLCHDADRRALYLSMPLPPHCRLEDAEG
ncbi:hypothetical protein EVG20_g9002 [Dentipellis fragilis]|uniref:F-box domain-containing protein n=1 Tax=Dentipellis fragilis TaxID=205917 RepID=A0A4Y9Y1A1_9AGAM|nr:hypothetical protein EVG20_g9002 [Dentipellis fragilis]